MRAIIINPYARNIAEMAFPVTSDFMQAVAKQVGSDELAIDAVPPHTAMFMDALGFLRGMQAFWRIAGGVPANNVAGSGILFGLDANGKLADLPPEVTIESLRERVLWVDDKIVNRIERMQIVDLPGGKAPQIVREIVWQPGAVTPASGLAPPEAAMGGVDLYSQGSPPAAVSPAPATPVAAKAPETASAPPLAPIWAIHETPDNRYRLIEYEVTEAGIGAVLSLATVPNLDEARARVPAGLQVRPSPDDAEDDTLVETWS